MANITTPHIAPFQTAYDPVDNRLYVTSPINSTVLAIDLTAHRIVATIPVPNGPWGITYGGGDVYVTEGYSNITAVISTATEQIVANLKGGNAPISVAYVGDPFGVAAYYGDNGMGGATWYDYSSGNPIAWTPISNGPEWVLYDPFNTMYYVFDYEGFLDAIQLVPSSSSSSISSSTSSFTSSSALFSSQSSTLSTSTTTVSTSTSGTGTSVSSSISVGVPGGLNWLDYAIIGIIVLLILLALFYLWWFRGLFGGKTPPPVGGPQVGKTPPPPTTPPTTPPPPIPVGPVVYAKKPACSLNTYWEFEQFTLTATVGEEKNPSNVPSAVLHHSTVRKPAGEPIPLSAVSEDKHMFIHGCTCDNKLDQKLVHLYALVNFEWQVTYGGGTFVRITGGPGKSAEVGDQVIYQPPVIPDGKTLDVKVEVKALHADPSKPPDHGPIILGINMKIKREKDEYVYEWWPANIASVTNPVNVQVPQGPCVTSGTWKQNTPIQGLISATLMIPGTSKLPLERPSGECAPGDYVRFEFKGDDKDDFLVNCTPPPKCDPTSATFPMLDRLNCDWSSTKGEFVKSISLYSLVAIWHAPDKEADVDIQVKVSDSQTQFVDQILVTGTKVLVRKKK